MDELLVLPGFSLDKAYLFIQERKRYRFISIEEIGELIDLKPHEVENLKRIAIVKYTEYELKGRLIDF